MQPSRGFACVALVAIVALSGCIPAPQMLVVTRPELAAGARVRALARYDGVSPDVREATVRAVRDAGFTVITGDDARQAEHALTLRAHCARDWLRRLRCDDYAVRIVDRATTEILASATLNPLARRAARLVEIRDSLQAGLARRAGAER